MSSCSATVVVSVILGRHLVIIIAAISNRQAHQRLTSGVGKNAEFDALVDEMSTVSPDDPRLQDLFVDAMTICVGLTCQQSPSFSGCTVSHTIQLTGQTGLVWIIHTSTVPTGIVHGCWFCLA